MTEGLRVLMTGCAGYIGRALARSLRERGIAVVGVDRDPWGADVAELGERMDLAEPGSVQRLATLMQGVDAVFHLAAARVDWGLDYAGYERDNVEVTRTVVEAAVLSMAIAFDPPLANKIDPGSRRSAGGFLA